jgi:hypothetical protein
MTAEDRKEGGRLTLLWTGNDGVEVTIRAEIDSQHIGALYCPLWQFVRGIGFGDRTADELLNDISE